METTNKENSTHSTIKPSEVHTHLSKHILTDGFHYAMDLQKSHGSYIYDAATETEILDGYTSFATVPIGYNHPKMTTEEFKQKIIPAALNNIANSDIYTVEFAEFVDKFVETLPEAFKSHVFFVAGGALAVENALKTAFDWKVRKNIAKGVGEKGHKVIHFKEAFHGRSGYTLSLTNTDPKKTMYFPKFEWPRIINPKLSFVNGKVPEEVLKKVIETEKLAVEQIEKAVKEHQDDIAALIVEPIQGEGGDNHFRKEFFQKLRELADKHEFLLIFDEVQTGFGTTGKWWAFEHIGVQPDIFSFGKKTQVCGIAATRRIDDVDNVFKVSSRINSTWGGNLVDMVRCAKIIEIIQQEKLLNNAARVGEILLNGLIDLERKYKEVTNSRGLGMFVAFDLPDGEVRKEAMSHLRAKNILVLTSGTRSLRVRPPLTLSPAEAIEMLKRIDQAFHAIFKEHNVHGVVDQSIHQI